MSIMAEQRPSPSRKRKSDHGTRSFARKVRKTSEEPTSESQEAVVDADSDGRPNRRSKKERKQNPSTRIHSLRKLLARDSLPSTVRQEKERELAALVHDQERDRSKKQAKKILEKYHYVRFVERQKAEKKLKQLRKQLANGDDDGTIAARLQEMEVNRNYAIYAPLNQKYISLFASKTDGGGEDEMDGRQTKPSTWFLVREAMKDGQTALEALRESKSAASASNEATDSGVPGRGPTGRALKQRKTGSSESHEGLQAARRPDSEAAPSTEDASEEDMSDGGFFER